MINLFQIAAEDKSIVYLGNIFGSMNGLLPGDELSLLGTMFKTFNTTILAVAALLLVYMTIVGVMATAHEGEFMGKKWNNIWIPIRSVLGIAMMVPTASGYSGLQVVMMWVIIQGIGAADTLWNTALSYVSVVGSPYSQVDLPGVGVQQTMAGLFQGLACDATARISKPDPSGMEKGGYFCATQKNAICGNSISFQDYESLQQMPMGPDGGCGNLQFCNATTQCATPNSLDCLACKAQMTSLETVVQIFAGIATEFANADYSYRDFLKNSSQASKKGDWQWIYNYCADNGIRQQNCCVQSDSPLSTCPQGTNFIDPNADGKPQNASPEAVRMYWKYWPQLGPKLGQAQDFLKPAIDYYMSQANAAYTTYLSTLSNQPLSGTLGDAQKAGWIFAGGYYYAIANNNTGNIRSALPSLTFNPPGDIVSGTMSNYRNNYSAATDLLNAAFNAGGSSASQASSQGTALVSSATSSVTANFNQATTSSGVNPLIQIQSSGIIMLIVVEALFVGLLALILVTGLLGFINVFALGTGFINPAGPSAMFWMMFLMPAVYALMGYMVTIGGLLGIYTPLIPYIMFTFGAIGWLISVVEAMVAGPLVALGVISPSGHHELLGKAEPALMLLFNVFLRPSLMIFGLMAAMLLAVVIVKMINALFWPIVFVGMKAQGGTSVLAMLMLLAAWVMLILSALNKCFAVINVIPQQVMRWISGQGEQVEAPLSEIKGGTEAVGGAAKGGITQSAKGGRKVAKGLEAEAKENQKKQSKLTTDEGKNPPSPGGENPPEGEE